MSSISYSAHADPALSDIKKLKHKSWFSGAENCHLTQQPAIEVYQYNLDSYILRQNKCLHYEAPFIYLLFGKERALLIDTGATADPDKFPLAEQVKLIMAKRAKQLKLASSSLPLLVAHSHSHSDHIAADHQFSALKHAEVINTHDTKALVDAFSLSNWPLENVKFDLGDRPVTIIPTPGHQAQAISFYDQQNAWLLTGDSVYPGRLYVRNWQVYKNSIQRLVSFSQEHQVLAVLGAHIEMSTKANVDYPVESTYHANEMSLVLSVTDLKHLHEKLTALGDTPRKLGIGKMIIYPVN
ncbi:MBL fold metallo-hydrolase [Thalassotalea sp. PLHSN55]|uniref:MBL fold metallo-hydrolase n=1 Tax=Thalassotalea sp. PLHSN55 TaxID=3435888 RepID=UPI003F8335A2